MTIPTLGEAERRHIAESMGTILEHNVGLNALAAAIERASEDPHGSVVSIGLFILVSTRPYTNRIDPEWLRLHTVIGGDAAPYPLRASIPGRGEGQWSVQQVLAVAAHKAISEATIQEQWAR